MEFTPLRYRIAMALYQFALTTALPLIWFYFRRRGARDAAYLDHWDERRGLSKPFDADIWIHAVSLGEFRSAEPLIARLLSAGKRIALTHATPAGRRASEAALTAEIASGQVRVSYAPIDRMAYWRKYLRTMRPDVGLVMEMEFWPGMIEAAREEGVSLWLTNSQVPGRSYARAQRVARWLGSHPLARARGVFAKSERMADRFIVLGAEDVRVVGETRFDIPAPERHVAAGRALAAACGDRPIVTFASVVSGEEEVYQAAAEMMLRATNPPLVMWVPRAPEAFGDTFTRLANAGFRVGRRSTLFDRDLNRTGELACDILLGDSFGEMFFYLAASRVVSVGGGFVEKGAHNIIEPLALAKPVVTGPHIWTIEFPGEEARQAGVLTVCDTPDKLAGVLVGSMKGDGAAEADFHAAYTGASKRIADAILNGDIS